MTKKQADYYLHRCYRLLADPDATLRHRKFRAGTFQGIAHPKAKAMTVDFRQEALSTVIHECLHVIYGDNKRHPGSRMDANKGDCSKWVQETEEAIVYRMTERQFQNLCFRIAVFMGHK